MKSSKVLRQFSDLASLKKTIQLAAAEQAKMDAQAAENHLRTTLENNLFSLSVGSVQPLKISTPTLQISSCPEPMRLPGLFHEEKAMSDSLSDEWDVGSLLETERDTLSFRRPGVGPDVVRQLRQGAWAVRAHLDLHGLRSDEARERLTEFLQQVTLAGHRCVSIIHGKGHGSPAQEPVLKTKVKRWLVQRSDVLAFTHAPEAHGGEGALWVLLKPLGTGKRKAQKSS